MTVLAETRSLVKRFGEVTAVDHVSTTVTDGEVVGLLGANGAGKTTLIRCLLGLTNPTEGDVELFGSPPSRSGLRRIGYVPQGLGLYTDLTVGENLTFRSRIYGASATELPPDLAPYRDMRVASLSLGLQRRVAFAIAGSHGPELLVLDEPTSGVGPLGRARLWETIRERAETGIGVLVTTHHIEEAEQCDRLVMMAMGRVVATGSVDEITAGTSTVVVETRDWQTALTALDEAGVTVSLAGTDLRVPGGNPDQIEDLLRHSGVDVELTTRPATLEERFVTLAS